MKLLLISLLLLTTLYAQEDVSPTVDNDLKPQMLFKIGQEYYFGKNMDSIKALKYFKQACNQNHYEACSNVGLIYYYGHGVVQDDIKAKAYFAKACIGKYPLGCEYYHQIDTQLISE